MSSRCGLSWCTSRGRTGTISRPATRGASLGAAYRAEIPDAWLQIDGYSDSPDRGTAEQGTHFLELAISAVADALLEFTERTKDIGRDGTVRHGGDSSTPHREGV